VPGGTVRVAGVREISIALVRPDPFHHESAEPLKSELEDASMTDIVVCESGVKATLGQKPEITGLLECVDV
jgi:hypothetical protein